MTHSNIKIDVSSRCDRNDHTTVTESLPVCSAKLSTVGPDFSPVHRIALQYSFCSDRLAWHGDGGKAMTICTYFEITLYSAIMAL
eukprot:scaffold13051_cov151-Skeletonema_marinoi.AAC.1